MFSKALILLLLGSTLVLAAPHAGEDAAPETSTQASKAPSDRAWSLWTSVVDKVKNAWDSGVVSATKALQELKAQGQYASELGKDAYEYLKEKGTKIGQDSIDAIKAEKDKWVKKIQEAKNNTVETAQVISYKVKELQQKAEQAIKDQMKNTQDKWEQWRKEAQAAYKAEDAKKNQPK